MCEEHKYNVGDTVIIKDYLQEGYGYKIYVTEEMEKFAGKTATISKVVEGTDSPYDITEYRLDCDDCWWSWTEDMFYDYGDVPSITYETEEIDLLYEF